MAWRPGKYLLEGELDNTIPGKVTGWMRFAGIKNKVTFDLKGDFHRDIRKAKIRFTGDGEEGDVEAASYMEGFAQHQRGNAGDITAGLPPQDYVDYPYIEWYGGNNGRVVIELAPEQVRVIGTLLPWMKQEPVSRTQQSRNMANFLGDIAHAVNLPPEHVVCIGGKAPTSTTKTPDTERTAR